MNRFRGSKTDLKARQMVRAVYRATESMPSEEKFVLTQQMRRAAISVHINLAEGYGRDTTKEFLRFTSIARGSLIELQALMDLATDLGLLKDPSEVESLCEECSRIVSATRKSLRAKVQS